MLSRDTTRLWLSAPETSTARTEESNLIVEVVGLAGFCAGASLGLGGVVVFWGSVTSKTRGRSVSIVKCPQGDSNSTYRNFGARDEAAVLVVAVLCQRSRRNARVPNLPESALNVVLKRVHPARCRAVVGCGADLLAGQRVVAISRNVHTNGQ